MKPEIKIIKYKSSMGIFFLKLTKDGHTINVFNLDELELAIERAKEIENEEEFKDEVVYTNTEKP